MLDAIFTILCLSQEKLMVLSGGPACCFTMVVCVDLLLIGFELQSLMKGIHSFQRVHGALGCITI